MFFQKKIDRSFDELKKKSGKYDEKGNLIQEMYYDDNGNLKTGKIIVKDKVAGFPERTIRLAMENGKPSFIG